MTKSRAFDLLLVPSLRDEMLTLTNFAGHPSLTLRAGFVEVSEARSVKQLPDELGMLRGEFREWREEILGESYGQTISGRHRRFRRREVIAKRFRFASWREEARI